MSNDQGDKTKAADDGPVAQAEEKTPLEPAVASLAQSKAGTVIIGVARQTHSAIEFCGKHPFVTGLFAILSVVGLLLTVVGYRLDRNEAQSTATQVQRVEEKIDEMSSSIDTPSLTLDDESGEINKYWMHLRFSFTRNEYVNPRIVHELLGLISDSAETVTQIDLVASNQSNRFYAKPIIRDVQGREWVYVEYGSDEGYFAYSYVATSPSGVHLLESLENTGGRSTFYSIILLTLNSDKSLDPLGDGVQMRERVMLKTLGSIILGDRYHGEITYDGKNLRIGADQSRMKFGQRFEEELIPIE
jgi:hypothetical protein